MAMQTHVRYQLPDSVKSHWDVVPCGDNKRPVVAYKDKTYTYDSLLELGSQIPAWHSLALRLGSKYTKFVAIDCDGQSAIDMWQRIYPSCFDGLEPYCVYNRKDGYQLFYELTDEQWQKLSEATNDEYSAYYVIKEIKIPVDGGIEVIKTLPGEQLEIRLNCLSMLPGSLNTKRGTVYQHRGSIHPTQDDYVFQFIFNYVVTAYNDKLSYQEENRYNSRPISPESRYELAKIALTYIDPNLLDWDQWSQTLMSCHNCGMSYEEVLEWSKKSAKHTDNGFDDVWNYLRRDKTKQLGLRSLLNRAKKYGYNGYNAVFQYPEGLVETEPEDNFNVQFLSENKEIQTYHISSKEEQVELYDRLIDAGVKHIINMAVTGFGKTTVISRYRHESYSINYITKDKYDAVNISPDFADWAIVPSRHGGLVSEMGTDGKLKIRRRESSKTSNPIHYEDANCIRYPVWKASLDMGIDLPSVTTKNDMQRSVLCNGCPLFSECTGKARKTHKSDSGFLANRRFALSQERVISHYLSLPPVDTYDYDQRIGVLDEFGSYNPILSKVFTINDMTTSLLFYHSVLPSNVIQLIMSLIEHVKATGKTKYGFTQGFFTEWLEQHITDCEQDIDAIDVDLLSDMYEQFIVTLVEEDDVTQFKNRIFNNPIPDIIRFLKKESSVYLSLTANGEINISTINRKFLDTIGYFRHLIILDATLDLQEYITLMNVKPNEIAVIYSDELDVSNVSFYHLHGIGTLGKNRNDAKKNQINELKSVFLKTQKSTGFIDFTDHIDVDSEYLSTNWMGGSRGSNAFVDTKNLVLIGLPVANLNQMVARYSLIYGKNVEEFTKSVYYRINSNNHETGYEYVCNRMEFADEGLRRYLRLMSCREIKQAVGRLRSQHRMSENLQVYFVGDYAPPSFYTVECLHISDISKESTDPQENAICRILKAIKDLPENVCNYTNIAKLSKTTNHLVSWVFNEMKKGAFGFVPIWCENVFNDCKDKIKQLLITPVSKTKKSVPISDNILKAVAPVFDDENFFIKKRNEAMFNCYNHRQTAVITESHVTIDEDSLDIDVICDSVGTESPRISEVKPITDQSIWVLDIETSGLDREEDRIYMIGLRNVYTDETLVLSEYDETIILKAFYVWVQQTKPYALVGYNLQEFDVPFIYERFRKYGLPCPFSTRSYQVKLPNTMNFGNPYWFKEFYCSTKTNQPIQIYDLYHQVKMSESILTNVRSEYTKRLTSFDLKTVTLELGLRETERLVLSHNEISEAWENDKDKLVEYLIYDLEDTALLAKRLMPTVYYQQKYINASMQRLLYMGAATKWTKILEVAYQGNVPTPDDSRNYEGGLVLTRSGFYRNICKVDVTSLYPSIMLNYGITSRKDNKKYLLTMLKHLKDERLRLKALSKNDPNADQMQGALKVLINSAYGLMGTGGIGFNDYTAAALVTAYGRAIAKRMICIAQENGATVCQVDTDGMIFSSDSKEQNKLIYQKIQEALPPGIQIKLELLADALYVPQNRKGQPIKKSYLIFDNGKLIDSCGLYIKRNRSILERTFESDMILAYLRGGTKEMMSFYDKLRSDIVLGRYPVERLSITRRIGRGDKYLLQFGKLGDKITYYRVGDSYNVTGRYNTSYYRDLLEEMLTLFLSAFERSQKLEYVSRGQLELDFSS